MSEVLMWGGYLLVIVTSMISLGVTQEVLEFKQYSYVDIFIMVVGFVGTLIVLWVNFLYKGSWKENKYVKLITEKRDFNKGE